MFGGSGWLLAALWCQIKLCFEARAFQLLARVTVLWLALHAGGGMCGVLDLQYTITATADVRVEPVLGMWPGFGVLCSVQVGGLANTPWETLPSHSLTSKHKGRAERTFKGQEKKKQSFLPRQGSATGQLFSPSFHAPFLSQFHSPDSKP